MSMHLGKSGLIKEFFLEIDTRGQSRGFLDLVSKGKVSLEGFVTEINDRDLFEPFSQPPKLTKEFEKRLPLKLHFKEKKPISESDTVFKELVSRKPQTPKEFLANFENNWYPNAKIFAIQIDGTSILHIYGCLGRPRSGEAKYCDIGLGEDQKDVEILKAKNVPGLKDVKK